MDMEIKFVSLDNDGCMVGSGVNTPWPIHLFGQVNAIFLELKKRNIAPFMNTGRSGGYVQALMQALGFTTTVPHLCENGAVLFCSDNVWYISRRITETSKMHFDTAKEAAMRQSQKFGGTVASGRDASCTLYPPRGMKIEIFFDHICRRLRNLEHQGTVEITYSAAAVDITPKGITKVSGLLDICALFGWNIKEGAAVGDSRGDIPVLEEVGFPMCPANASDEVKELVRRRGGKISLLPTTEGTIDCLRSLLV